MIEKDNGLLKAVLNRSTSQIQDCIIEGEDVYRRDERGRTYLHLSVFLKEEELVRQFLSQGCDINEGDNDRVTALHRACRNGCEPIVKALMQEGANPYAEAKDSITPIHVAAAFGHVGSLSIILKSLASNSIGQIDIDVCDDQGHTPLHYACAEGHKRAIETLIAYDCNVNAENIRQNRPLHYAAANDSNDLCQPLVKAKADVDAQNINGQTALHIATQEACTSTIFHLLNAEADPNIRDANGNTCSHLAIKNGHINVLELLMSDSRTDPSISDNEKNTVLHVALKLGHYNLIPMMLPKARDLTKQDANGCSVIIEAIKNQLEDLALQMLQTCPDLVHTATHDLVTPLHLAAERGMTNLTKQLIIAGAQVDAADSSGLTPSLYCAKNDSVLECLAMIEDIMMMTDDSVDDNDHKQLNQHQHVKGNKISSRISS